MWGGWVNKEFMTVTSQPSIIQMISIHINDEECREIIPEISSTKVPDAAARVFRLTQY